MCIIKSIKNFKKFIAKKMNQLIKTYYKYFILVNLKTSKGSQNIYFQSILKNFNWYLKQKKQANTLTINKKDYMNSKLTQSINISA